MTAEKPKLLSVAILYLDAQEPLNYRLKQLTAEKIADEILAAVNFLSHRGCLPTRLQYGAALALKTMLDYAVELRCPPEMLSLHEELASRYLPLAAKWEKKRLNGDH